jgi:hypothetical protein
MNHAHVWNMQTAAAARFVKQVVERSAINAEMNA